LGELRGPESALNGGCRDDEHHCAQTSFTHLLKNDNGSEFSGKILDKWVYEQGSRIDFSRPGTPTDNATVQNQGLAHTL
jgi:putative transposase